MATARLISAADITTGNGALKPNLLARKLSSLATQARASNPLINPPLTTPAAWQANTAYTVGQIVTNDSGKQYLCLIAGTSAASGGPTGQSVGLIVDGAGSLRWEFYGVPAITTNDPSAPTITQQTAFPSGLTKAFTAASNPNTLRLYGATWTGASVSGSAYTPLTYTNGTGGGSGNKSAWRLKFLTDAPSLAVVLGNAGGYFRLVIDGRYYSVANMKALTAANPNYTIVDFSAVGGRKVRLIEIETVVGGATNTNNNIVGVNVDAASRIWRLPTDDDVRAAWIDDSLDDGASTFPALAGNTKSFRFAKAVGISDMWSMSKGGTGFINKGVGSAFYTFRERIPQVLAISPDIVFLNASGNDTSNTASAVTAAALGTLQDLRAGGFTGPIGVFGIWSVNDANAPATEAAVGAAVTAFNDPLTFWMPMYAGPDGPALDSTNWSTYLSTDNVHPYEVGNEYNAARAVEAYRRVMLPGLAAIAA